MDSTFPFLNGCEISRPFAKLVAIVKPTRKWRTVIAMTPEKKPEPGGT